MLLHTVITSPPPYRRRKLQALPPPSLMSTYTGYTCFLTKSAWTHDTSHQTPSGFHSRL